MSYRLNGNRLNPGTCFVDSNGTQYPSDWLGRSTEAQRAAVPTGGITWVADESIDGRYYYAASKPKDLADLKKKAIQDDKDTANGLLAFTDWLVIRAAEGGTAVPSDTKTARANVRTISGQREAKINAASSFDDFVALHADKLPPTVAGTSSNGATEKKQEDGSSYDPKQWNDIRNPDRLEEWPGTPT